MTEQQSGRPSSPSRRISKFRRLAVLAVLLAGVGCDITGPDANVSGVWEARFDFPQANDSLFLVLTQDGSTVKGYGFLRTPANNGAGARPVYSSFGLGGSVTGIAADLSLSIAAKTARLSGFATGNKLAGVVDAGGGDKYSVTLHRVPQPPQMSVGGELLQVVAGELRRPYNATTEHFTRVSTAADLR